MSEIIHQSAHGVIICGDCTAVDTVARVRELVGGPVNLIVCDPPYGGIVNESWDRAKDEAVFVENLSSNLLAWGGLLDDGAALYFWGCVGKKGMRPFPKIIDKVESQNYEMANWITWSKKRAYGTKTNYLWTREELVWLVKNRPHNKPKIFNIPLLDEKRTCKPYNPKYQCKSEFLRRTNVWRDVTEILRGGDHPCVKPSRLHEIVIETHTHTGDWVIDPYGGTGCTAIAAIKTGRRFVLVERDLSYCEKAKAKIEKELKNA